MGAWVYIVLLGLVIVVYAKFVPKRETDSRPTNVMKEIEETMEQFSADLEEENRQLIELVSQMKKDHDVHIAKLQGRLEAIEQQNRAFSDQFLLLERKRAVTPLSTGLPEIALAPNVVARLSAQPGAASDKPPAETPPERVQTQIRERYASVFELYNQGKSTDYIAKKLEMNKGEVMLIIQLAKQEDQARV